MLRGFRYFAQNRTLIIGSCIYPTCHDKNSFNAKLDTHVDTHTCEKIRKNAVKNIRCASRFRIAKIPVKQLIKPFGGD